MWYVQPGVPINSIIREIRVSPHPSAGFMRKHVYSLALRMSLVKLDNHTINATQYPLSCPLPSNTHASAIPGLAKKSTYCSRNHPRSGSQTHHLSRYFPQNRPLEVCTFFSLHQQSDPMPTRHPARCRPPSVTRNMELSPLPLPTKPFTNTTAVGNFSCSRRLRERLRLLGVDHSTPGCQHLPVRHNYSFTHLHRGLQGGRVSWLSVQS